MRGSLLVFSALCALAGSARILGVFQIPAHSHQSVFQPIWKELSLRGHQVTVVTTKPLKDPTLVNLTEIDVSLDTCSIFQSVNFIEFMSDEYSVYLKVDKLFEVNSLLAEALLSNKQFIKVYNDSKAEFDVVLVQTFFSPVLYAVAAKLGSPLIGVSSLGTWLGGHYAIGNPAMPSLYPDIFFPFRGIPSFPESPEMRELLLLFPILWTLVDSARILGVFQIPSYSHQTVFRAIWRELSLRGHQVTVITPNPLKDPGLVNLTEIDVSQTASDIFSGLNFPAFMSDEQPFYAKIKKIFELNYELAETLLSNEEFVKVYNDSEAKFDVVLAQTFFSPALYAVAAKLDAPLVGIASLGTWVGGHQALGNPVVSSLYSEIIFPQDDGRTFSGRFRNTLYYIWTRYVIQ
nr:unnamed protein product [Callosobruchus analis]